MSETWPFHNAAVRVKNDLCVHVRNSSLVSGWYGSAPSRVNSGGICSRPHGLAVAIGGTNERWGQPTRATQVPCPTMPNPHLHRPPHLQICSEEDGHGIKKESWSRAVVVTLHDDEVLITGILLVDLLTVMVFDEVVVLAGDEKGRNEALIGVLDG